MKCVGGTCTQQALSGFSKCQKCLDKNVIYMRNRRAKDQLYYEREMIKNRERRDRYEAEGRCRECSKKLDPGADAGKRNCINCRERAKL